MSKLTRRTLLKLTAAALPAFAMGCHGGFEPEAVPESVDRFPRTPIAGDMTKNRVVIAFYVDDDSPVTLRVWTDLESVVDQYVESSGDGFHKVMIDNLEPGTTYKYALFFGEAPDFEDRSLICTVKTAPSEDSLVPVRIALLSCVGQGTIIPDFYFPESTSAPTEKPFTWEVFTHAADQEIDVFVHLGDQGYLDLVWSEEAGATDAYLNAWGFYHGGGYRDVYPLAGVYATWDDHEVTDNRHFDPWAVSDEDLIKVNNAKTAWYKVIPIDAQTPEERPVWRNFRWGKTLELILLDCRYELEEDRLMSEEQLTWLLERIEASPCRFVCVATPKPFSNITSSQALLADNAARWDGYPSDRARLTERLDLLEASNVIFVTGDIHMNYLGRASVSGDAVSDRSWEVSCTSGNANPVAGSLSPEQYVFVDAAPHLPVLTFDPTLGTVHVAFYAADGSLSFDKTLSDL
jgi:alkaline phosphatase D